MKKRAILRELEALAHGIYVDDEGLDARVRALEGKLAAIDDLASKLTWLHERVDLMATRLEAMRGDITLDDAAAKRLTYAVGQFSARLDRLEQPRPRGRPRKRPQLPAGPNGEAERTQPPPTTTDPTGEPKP